MAASDKAPLIVDAGANIGASPIYFHSSHLQNSIPETILQKVFGREALPD